MIMEGGDKDIKANVNVQHDNELIRTERDQSLEDRSELDFE
jgi:hypothetical protein